MNVYFNTGFGNARLFVNDKTTYKTNQVVARYQRHFTKECYCQTQCLVQTFPVQREGMEGMKRSHPAPPPPSPAAPPPHNPHLDTLHSPPPHLPSPPLATLQLLEAAQDLQKSP